MRLGLTIPPGLVGDDTSFAAKGRWADGSNVRFRLGRPETIGGWESLTVSLLSGVCRSVFPWTDNLDILNVGFGTHTRLQVWVGGALYDITPTLALPAQTLAASPLSVTTGQPTVTVTQKGHGLASGNTVNVSGATAVGGITPNGGPFSVTRIDANTWSYAFTSNATSSASGGGSVVIVTPQVAYAAGQIDGTGGDGYGTGGYGIGGYGLPSATEYFPRTWSLGAWGQQLLASFRNGPLYLWQNDTAQKAQPLQDAPRQITYALVAPMEGGYMAFALGCNQEADGVFNPMCIRHSGVRDLSQWTTTTATTAREYILTGGGRIVAGRMCGDFLLVWTDHGLQIGEYVGNLDQPWSFRAVGEKCGLAGPGAVVVVGQTAYWTSPDRQFWSYTLGSQPTPVTCPIRDDYAENLAAAQSDKIVASSIAEFSEIRFDYPDKRDGSGYENSRYMALSVSGPDAGAWYRGKMARTAMVDAGPSQFPIGVTFDGHVYYHEAGQSADGGVLSWFIETADQYLDENMVMGVDCVWPDIFQQVGPVFVEVMARMFPQDTPTTTGPMTMGVGAQKVDFRLTGRLFRVQFSGGSSPTWARLGKFDFNVSPRGSR